MDKIGLHSDFRYSPSTQAPGLAPAVPSPPTMLLPHFCMIAPFQHVGLSPGSSPERLSLTSSFSLPTGCLIFPQIPIITDIIGSALQYQLPGQTERHRRTGHFFIVSSDWVHNHKVLTILYLCLCSDDCVTARSSDDTALSTLASATPAHLLLPIHSELGN